ncbi:MAG: hypothetical protein SFY69_06245 [Planctomycetota bacterium]|nr:hypothetical protein [Planctomycetota bacterium]
MAETEGQHGGTPVPGGVTAASGVPDGTGGEGGSGSAPSGGRETTGAGGQSGLPSRVRVYGLLCAVGLFIGIAVDVPALVRGVRGAMVSTLNPPGVQVVYAAPGARDASANPRFEERSGTAGEFDIGTEWRVIVTKDEGDVEADVFLVYMCSGEPPFIERGDSPPRQRVQFDGTLQCAGAHTFLIVTAKPGEVTPDRLREAFTPVNSGVTIPEFREIAWNDRAAMPWDWVFPKGSSKGSAIKDSQAERVVEDWANRIGDVVKRLRSSSVSVVGKTVGVREPIGVPL